MAFNYINSQGQAYTLHEKTTTYFNGDLRRLYYFANAECEGAVDALPEGFDIEEDDTGCPHLRRAAEGAKGLRRLFGKPHRPL
jgi:hypothetical protein